MLVLKPEKCGDVRWSIPVVVQLRFGFPEPIEGTALGIELSCTALAHCGGEAHVKARHLGDCVPCETVRAAFVAAAEEADLLALAPRH